MSQHSSHRRQRRLSILPASCRAVLALTILHATLLPLGAQDPSQAPVPCPNGPAAPPQVVPVTPPSPVSPPETNPDAQPRPVTPDPGDVGRTNQRRDAVNRLEPSEVYRRTLQATAWVRIPFKDGPRLGTAWVLDVQRRLLVTNHHVIDGVERVTVYFPVFENGVLVTDPEHYVGKVRPIIGTVVDCDARCDLALIQVERVPDGSVALELAARSPVPGERLHSVAGLPEGSDGLWVYSTGHVRQVTKGDLANGYESRIVESDAATNRGNSGGPVVNDRAQVVAVVEGHVNKVRLVSIFIDVMQVRSYVGEALRLLQAETAADFHRRGTRWSRDGRHDQAIRDFTTAIRRDRTLAAAYCDRGWAFFKKGDFQTAVQDFDDALKNEPSLVDACRGRGLANRALGQLEKSIADLTDAIRIDPESFALYNERGITHFRAKQYEPAVEDFSRAIRLAPNNAQLYGNRGDALQYLNRHEEAVHDLLTAIKQNPRTPKFFNLLGVSYSVLRQYDKAAVAYLAAIERDGHNAVYRRNLGDALRRLGKHEMAIAAYSSAIELSANNAYLYFARGLSRCELRQLSQAVEDFTRAIQLDSSYAAAYYRRGVAHQALGNANQAQDDFRTAARLDPEHFAGHSKPADQVAASGVVGKWRFRKQAGGMTVDVVAVLDDRGNYASRLHKQSADGQSFESTEKATYQVQGQTLVFTGKSGQIVRRFELKDSMLWVEFPELGYRIAFQRVS